MNIHAVNPNSVFTATERSFIMMREDNMEDDESCYESTERDESDDCQCDYKREQGYGSTANSSKSTLIEECRCDSCNGNNDDDVLMDTNAVAKQYSFTEAEQGLMNIAVGLVEKALDMEWDDDESDCDNDDDDDEDMVAPPKSGDNDDNDRNFSRRSTHRRKQELSLNERKEALFKAAIRIQESIGRSNRNDDNDNFPSYGHPCVTDTYHSYGWFLYEQGRLEEAMVYLSWALKICHQWFGVGHTATKILLNDVRFLVDKQQKRLQQHAPKGNQDPTMPTTIFLSEGHHCGGDGMVDDTWECNEWC